MCGFGHTWFLYVLLVLLLSRCIKSGTAKSKKKKKKKCHCYFPLQPPCLSTTLQYMKQDRSIGTEKRVVPANAMLLQHHGPRGFAGCQAAVNHRAVCLFSLPPSWPYGAWGSQGHCVSQICLRVRVCVCVCVYTCARVYVWRVRKTSQICSLVSVDLSAGRIDFVSICIFLPAKNTFISSTNIDAGKQFTVFSHSAVLELTQWLGYFSLFIQGFFIFFFNQLHSNKIIGEPERVVSPYSIDGLKQVWGKTHRWYTHMPKVRDTI